jgi:hypothetical protein
MASRVGFWITSGLNATHGSTLQLSGVSVSLFRFDGLIIFVSLFFSAGVLLRLSCSLSSMAKFLLLR